MGRGTSKVGSGGGGKSGAKKPIDLTTASVSEIRQAIQNANTENELNNIIETIANNDVISNQDYSDLYGEALTKLQMQQPTANVSKQTPFLIRGVLDVLNNQTGRFTFDTISDISSNIKGATEIGDVFEFTGNSGAKLSWKKIGNNKWVDSADKSATFTDGGMARLMAQITGIGGRGKWKYKER